MSKNITIQEGGLAKQLTANKLKTNLVGGGTCLWVPEDETQLGTKIITENGTYKASDDGYYGYSEVTVSGVGSVTGTDGDGDEATVTTGGDGELVITKNPSSIKVDTPPSLLVYSNGETIDFSGIVVKAYLKSGGIWSDSSHPNGIIPFSELVFPDTTAIYKEGDSTADSDLFCGIVKPFAFNSTATIITNTYGQAAWLKNYIKDSIIAQAIAVAYNGGNGYAYVVASETPNAEYTKTRETHYTPDDPSDPRVPSDKTTSETSRMTNSYTHNNKTVYFAGGTSAYSIGIESITPISTILINSLSTYIKEIAWTMIYGDIQSLSGHQDVPVQWARPSTILETSFEITVSNENA